MNVVGPGEVDGVVVARKTQIALGNLDCHVSAVNDVSAICNLGGLIAVAAELFKHDGVGRCGGLVDNKFKGFPALICLIGVQVKGHPQRVGVGGDVGCALYVEVNELVIASDLRADDVVSARGLGVNQIAIAGVISVLGVADVCAEVRLNCLPLLLTGVQINGGLFAGSGDGVNALVLTDEVDQLIVVVVLQVALGRLNVTGEFVVILVGECIGNSRGRALGPGFVSANAEFVPAGHEYNGRVNLKRVCPLLCEVVAPLGGLVAFLFVAIGVGGGVGTARDVVATHSGQLAQLVVVVHCDTNRDLLNDAVGLVLAGGVVLILRIHGKPAPGLVFGVIHHVTGSAGAEGKELGNFLFQGGGVGVKGLRDRHQHRLAVQVVPKVLVLVGAVDILVDRGYLHVGVGLVPEGEHEGQLGGLEAVGHSVVPFLEQGVVGGVPGVVAVGVVGKDNVNAGVGQKLCLLAQNPGVLAAVEAVDGLIPPVGGGALPDLVVVISHCLGILFAVFLQVDGLVVEEAAGVPGPVEHSHGLAVTGSANVRIGQRGSAQTVGKYPGVGLNGVGVDQAVCGNHVFVGSGVVAVDAIRGISTL